MVDGQNGEDNIMKRFLLVAVSFFLVLALAGCDQVNETAETTKEETYVTFAHHSYAGLEFTSLEELVETYKTVKEGKAIGDLARDAKNTNFSELDKIYAPTAIPEGYQLSEIKVLESIVMFWYSSESSDQDFEFVFFRHGGTMEDVVLDRNATEDDLIDGKYWFEEPNALIWDFDGVLCRMNMPLPLLDKQPDEQAKIAEMIRYAEVEVVDLGG